MKSVASSNNPIFKQLKNLNTAKGRREQGLFIAEGPHLMGEALKAGATIRYAAVRDDAVEKNRALLQAAVNAGAEALILPLRLFNALADTDTPQGILVVAGIRQCNLLEFIRKDSCISIVLERVQDPGNLGTILRTTLAVNAGFAAVTSDSADPWSQKVVRSSQGAIFHLPIIEVGNATGAVRAMNAEGWHTACGCINGENFFSREAHEKTAVVIGNEAAGVNPETARACSARYKLPMPGKAESLNAAVAAGIMLYDIWREQQL